MPAGTTDPRTQLHELAARARDLREQLQGLDSNAEGADALLTEAEQVAAEHARLAAEVTQLDADEAARTQRAAAARDAIASIGGGAAAPRRAPTTVATREMPELGVAQRFTADPRWQSFVERSMAGQVAVDFPEMRIADLTQRTLVTTTTQPGATKIPYVGSVIPGPDRPLRIADLVDRQTTGANAVPYIIETDGPTGALEVSEGAAKPELAVTFTEAESPVRTIAGWLPITRQAAEDSPTLVGYIEGRLGFKVLYRLDAQILSGDGVAPNLRGILNTSGIGTVAPGTAEARIISLRKALTAAQVAEYAPDTVVMHPTDVQIVELYADTTGNFIVNKDVSQQGVPRIWGLNVVVTTAITAGVALVGAFKMGATLWERHGVRLLMTDSHASNFTSNILVLLAEMRAALTVWRPAAFVRVTFNGTT